MAAVYRAQSTSFFAAIADIDGDGDLEILVQKSNPHQRISVNYAFHHDGTMVNGWPISFTDLGYTSCSPAIVDLEGDGDVEIIIPTDAWMHVDEFPRMYAFHHDGTIVDGWPQVADAMIFSGLSAPAIGDIDGDGYIEVVSKQHVEGPTGYIWAWNHDGTVLDGFPVHEYAGTDYGRTSEALADIDGDGDIEIIASSCISFNGVCAWHHDGQVVDGFPISLPDQARSTPCLGDIDDDGDIELGVACDDYRVYIWDLPGAYNPEHVEWGMAEHNIRHTGLYHTSSGHLKCSETWSGTIYISGDVTVPAGKILTIGPGTKIVFKANSDDQNSGIDPDKCELIVHGVLNVTGTDAYPVTFTPSSSQIGSWYGIRIMDNAIANFAHCTVENGYNGITIYNGAIVNINNRSRITDNECAGIVRGSKWAFPILMIDNSYISNNGVYGIHLQRANVRITGCTISDNHSYGLHLSFCGTRISDSDVLIYVESEPQYGIFLDGGSIIMERTKALTYGQGGVSLTRANARITGSEIRLNRFYGLYADSRSHALVSYTEILDHYYNIYATGNSFLDLGDQESGDTNPGQNSIYSRFGGTWYYVVNANEPLPLPVLAEYNWWGRDPPDETRFVGIVDYVPWLPGPPASPPGGGPQSLGGTGISECFSIHPNPVKSYCSVKFNLNENSRMKIALYDACGSLVRIVTDKQFPVGVNALKINTSDLASGVYFLHFLKDSETVATEKLLIVK